MLSGMNVRKQRCAYLGLGLAVVGLAIAGCGKQAPTTSPPVEAGDETASTQQDVRPGEVVNTYEGQEGVDEGEGEGEGEGEDEAGDDEADGASEAAPADDGKLDAVELLALANTALDQVLEPGVARMVTPLLPTEWPSTSGKVMVLAYPMAALESGVTRYTLFVALYQVTIDVDDGTVATESIGKKGKKLGSFEKTRERSDDPIHGAEQALVDVVAGRRPPEKARMLLLPYTQWVEGHGAVGKDVNVRMKGFLEALQKKL